MKDFFISYTKVDEERARWVAWHLRQHGYSASLMADWHPGEIFILNMHQAIQETRKTLVILSPAYMDSIYGKLEWSAVLAQDPTGKKRLLTPIRIEPVEDPGLLAGIISIDLVGMQEDEAIEQLLAGVGESYSQASKPAYPSNTSASSTSNPSGINNSQSAAPSAEHYLGYLDRKPQYSHFAEHIKKDICFKNGQTRGFILSGAIQEWPEGVRFKLFYLLVKNLTGNTKCSPELKLMNTENPTVDTDPAGYLWELLAVQLTCEAQETTICNRLGQLTECHIFFRILSSDEADNQMFLAEMLAAWSKITLSTRSPSHFLLFIRKPSQAEKSKLHLWPFKKRPLSWREQMHAQLTAINLIEPLLPELEQLSPDDVDDWMKHHIKDKESLLHDNIRTALAEKFPKSAKSAIRLVERLWVSKTLQDDAERPATPLYSLLT